jgi:hypothetical protein
MNTPSWSDCKVAFSIEEDDPVWEQLSSIDGESKHLLPNGWELIETDCAGARCVAIFRVDGVPTIEDGRIIEKVLKGLK